MRASVNRRAVAALAVLVCAPALAPDVARADASRFTCQIQSMEIRNAWGDNILWAYYKPFYQEVERSEDVTLRGTASCTKPNVAGSFPVTLSADHYLHMNACLTPPSGSARIETTLRFQFASGLRDSRPFVLQFSPDLNQNPQPGTIAVDGGTASTVNWHFSYATSDTARCGFGETYVSKINVTGSFTVPVSKTNPKLFARPPLSPGHPDPIAFDSVAGRLYVGSFTSAAAALTGTPPPDTSPSQVCAYDTAGNRVASWTISGQTLTKAHGLTGIALDSAGRLYITDIDPPRVLRLDPATGQQTTYASFRDLVPCDAGGPAGDCSQESSDFGDRDALPNGAAFGPDGSLYVTDTTQGGIWKVPPGGGTPVLWYADPRFKSYIGPNGIRLMADQRTLMFVFSNSQPPGSTDQLQGAIYKLPINPDGTAGALERFWLGATNEGPDSLALAQSGNVYVALAGDGLRSGFVVLSPTGVELARRGSPTDTLTPDIAYDTVADVAFVGTRAIFTNSSNFGNNAANYAIFEYDAGDTGLAVHRPVVP